MNKIESTQNPLVKHLKKLREKKRYREEVGRLFIEGKKMIDELPLPPIKLLIQEGKEEAEGAIIVSKEVMESICGSKSPDGYGAEIEMPPQKPLSKGSRVLVLDGVSDPGNLGTLFRLAAAFNWDGLYLLPETCDPYNDKALRAAKGATFRVPFQKVNYDELPLKDYLWLAAGLKGDVVETIEPNQPIALLLGGEGKGLSEWSESHCRLITIPTSIESLNVATAGAILMHALSKKGPS